MNMYSYWEHRLIAIHCSDLASSVTSSSLNKLLFRKTWKNEIRSVSLDYDIIITIFNTLFVCRKLTILKVTLYSIAIILINNLIVKKILTHVDSNVKLACITCHTCES